MSDRFFRVQEFPKNMYTSGSPVVIIAGVLLHDVKTGNAVAQFKFQNISDKEILSISISLVAYGGAEEELEGKQNYQYRNLAMEPGQEFGDNKAIVMPCSETRSVQIAQMEITFSDHSSWGMESGVKWEAQFTREPLIKGLESVTLIREYKNEVSQFANTIPKIGQKVWLCSCGRINSEEYCTNCGISKEKVFDAYNVDYLNSVIEDREAKEQEKRQEQKERVQGLLKRYKILAIRVLVAILVVVVVALLAVKWFIPGVIVPKKQYDEAISSLEERNFGQAVGLFEDLGDYKDSKEKAVEARYAWSQDLINQSEYARAIDILQTIPDIEITDELLLDAYYMYAEQLIDEKKYEDAIEVLDEIEEYKPVQELKIQAIYQRADELYHSIRSARAKPFYFAIISQYSEEADEEIIKESFYRLGQLYAEEGDYQEAKDALEKVAGYKDADTILEELENYKETSEQDHNNDGGFTTRARGIAPSLQ